MQCRPRGLILDNQQSIGFVVLCSLLSLVEHKQNSDVFYEWLKAQSWGHTTNTNVPSMTPHRIASTSISKKNAGESTQQQSHWNNNSPVRTSCNNTWQQVLLTPQFTPSGCLFQQHSDPTASENCRYSRGAGTQAASSRSHLAPGPAGASSSRCAPASHHQHTPYCSTAQHHSWGSPQASHACLAAWAAPCCWHATRAPITGAISQQLDTCLAGAAAAARPTAVAASAATIRSFPLGKVLVQMLLP